MKACNLKGRKDFCWAVVSRSSCIVVIAAAGLLFIPGQDVKAAESQAQVTPERGTGVIQRQQQRKSSEDYKPIGARVGSFIFLPSINVEAEYNDNVFATQDGAQSDTLTRILPEIALNSDWNRHKLDLAFKPEIVRYYRLSDDNVENYDFTADGRVDVLRALKINMSAGYKIDHEDRGNPNAVTSAKSPTKTKTTDAHIELNYKPNWVSLDIGGDFTRNDFNDVTNKDGTITNNGDRNRDKKEITVRLGREYLPNTEMFVKTSYNAIDYKDAVTDSGENRDSDGYSVVVGTQLDFTKIVTGNVFGGYISQSYADANLEKIAGPTAGASINWDATPLMSINGTVSRTIQETTTTGSPGFMSSFVSLTVDYEILRPLTATANIKGTVQNYEGVGRTDKVLDASLGGEYLFNRNFSLNLNYAFKRKLSSSAGSSSTQNTVLLAGRVQF